MATPAAVEIATLLSASFRYRAYAATIPYLYRHKVLHRFRRPTLAESAVRGLSSAELRGSVHDIYCDMLLDAYRDFTGLHVTQDTGFAMVLFMIYIFTFDQEFERCREDCRADRHESVRESPKVNAMWNAYATYCGGLPRGPDAVALVEDRFATCYDTFRRRERVARELGDLGSTIALVELDSGLTFETLYDIITSLNGHEHDAECRAQFRAVGMAGKFLDDVRDVAEDIRAGLPNLFYAATETSSAERTRLAHAVDRRDTLSMHWFSSHCATAYSRYLDLTLAYYRIIRTAAFRLPLDLNWALLSSSRHWRRPIRRAPEPAR